VVSRPLIIPASAPIAAEAMIAKKIIVISESNALINAFISKIIQPEIKAAIEPTDKSIPPVVITKVAPIATMPINELRARILLTLPALKNASLTKMPIINRATRAMNGPAVFRSKPLRKFSGVITWAYAAAALSPVA
jgi:hypothetical protein